MWNYEGDRDTSGQPGTRNASPLLALAVESGTPRTLTFDGPPHPLTGERQKIRKSGFGSEEAAWDAIQEARIAVATETYVRPSRAKVSDFFEAWFPYIRTTTEATTAANYEMLARSYVLPWIGKRPIQEIVPSVLAALYSHLLTQGRRKRDTNWDMYRVWQDARTAKREIRPREIADKVGVTYAAARKAVQRYVAGRVPQEPDPGLSPKTVKTVHIMLSSAMATAVKWKYLSINPTEGLPVVPAPNRGVCTSPSVTCTACSSV